MINRQKLRGLITERGKTQKEVAKKLGISEKTFYSKMKKGVFGSDEIDAMIEYLNIEDPIPIFFTQYVTSKDTG